MSAPTARQRLTQHASAARRRGSWRAASVAASAAAPTRCYWAAKCSAATGCSSRGHCGNGAIPCGVSLKASSSANASRRSYPGPDHLHLVAREGGTVSNPVATSRIQYTPHPGCPASGTAYPPAARHQDRQQGPAGSAGDLPAPVVTHERCRAVTVDGAATRTIPGGRAATDTDLAPRAGCVGRASGGGKVGEPRPHRRA